MSKYSRHIRGAVFDVGVGLVLAAAVSSLAVFVAAPVWVAAKRGLKLIGIM